MKSINSPADINVSRILRLIWQKGGISRIEIASELGIDKSTVTKIVSSLADIGLVTELSQGDTGPLGGRKPIYLQITPSFACIGGVEINPGRYVCCILNMHGKVLFQHQEEIHPGLYEKDNYYGVFFRAFEKIAAEAEKMGIPLIGIGVGFPALVDSNNGVIIQSVPLMIHESFAFVKEVSKIIDIPVIIENDARCCCYGEQLLSANHNIQNMLFLLTEYRVLQPREASRKNLSVGLGFVVNGKILKGHECSAGEFRSILWNEGNRGQFYSGEDRLESVDNDVIQSVFFELAQHAAFLVNTLNLEQVYIGGIDKTYASKLLSLIQDRIKYQWPYGIERKYSVSLASLENLSVAYGSAAMYLEQLFALPSLSSRSGTGRSVLETFSDFKKAY